MRKWQDIPADERSPEDGYREAQRRIAVAREEGAKALNLNNLKLTQIPEEIAGLTGLTELRLSYNQLTDVGPLAGLTGLTRLYLDNNQLTDVGPLAGLTGLTVLLLHNNQLTVAGPLAGLTGLTGLLLYNNQLTDVGPLAGLTGLTVLYLHNNQLTDVGPLAGLTGLTRLDLRGNQLTDVGPLAGFTGLTELWLNNNQLTDVGPLAGLTGLTRLWLNNNQLTDVGPLAGLTGLTELSLGNNQLTDVGPLAGLTGLTKLWLHDNPITSLRPLRRLLEKELQLWFELSLKDGIHLQNCPLTDPPVEVAKQGTEAVLRYWESVKELDTIPNREGRILLIGHGKAGKTTLQYKLHEEETQIPPVTGEFPTTIGIQIQADVPFAVGGETYQARVWDFGGQKQQHITHQYFFGRRSLYVLLVERRVDNNLNFEYWLKIINTFGRRPGEGKTPVIILFNEKDFANRVPQRQFGQDVWEAYDGLKVTALSVDLSYNKAIGHDDRWEGVKTVIGEHLAELPIMTDILKPYAELPERLEAWRKAKQHYVPFAEFAELCASMGLREEAKQRDAADYLHALGEVLYYGDAVPALREVIIIDVNWATKALYAILEIPTAGKNGGRFTEAELYAVWDKDHSMEEQRLLTKLLLEDAFEVCFRLEAKAAYDFLAPVHLSDVGTDLGWSSDTNAVLRLRFRYDGILPPGIMERLIVRMHHRISGNRFYRFGAVFTDVESELEAFLRVEERPQPLLSVEINATGTAAAALLQELRRAVIDLHGEYSDTLNYEEEFACCCAACSEMPVNRKHYFDRQELIEMVEDGDLEVRCPVLRKRVSVLTLLHGVYPSLESEMLSRIDRRGMRTKAILAGVEETVRDTNQAVYGNATRLRELNDALLRLHTDLDTIKGDFFSDTAERKRYFARFDDLLAALPPKDQPKDASGADKDKIKVSFDLMKILGQYTPLEIDGLGLKYEWELDLTKAKRPRNWADFKRWFLGD